MSDLMNEAFQALKILDEDTFTINADGSADLKNFMDNDIHDELELIIDPLAETEEDVQESYLGKAILDCIICHSKVYKEPEEVIIDEEAGLANVGETCVYCQASDGYKVIGQVAEFCPECSEHEEETETVDSDKDYKSKINETLDSELKKKARLGFNKAKRYLEKKYPYIDIGTLFIDEGEISAENEAGVTTFSILPEDINLEEALTLMANPNNYVWFGPDALNDEELSNQWSYMDLDNDYIKKYPKASNAMENAGLHLVGDSYIKDIEPEFLIKVNLNVNKKDLKEDIKNISIETEDQKITVSAEDKEEHVEDEEECEGEMIEPITVETEEKFKSQEDNSDKFDDVDIDEFNEEEFDELGESYLKRVYENVKSYKTVKAATRGNKLKLEGIITFKSGKQGRTNFVFEAKSITKSGKLKFLGENKQFARGKKAFTLTGKADGKKLCCESLTYNYRARDEKNGQSKRLYGRVCR